MPFLRQSTSQVIRFGPCLDKTDGVTEETALTLAQADMRLSKDGGAFAQKSAAGNATHDSDGWYSTTLSATDTATVGELILNVHQPANMLPVWMRFFVVEEEVYDDIFAASAVGYLKPATAGRDLTITATGAASINWGDVENPTTAVDLSATDIQLVDTTTVAGSVTGAVGSVTGAVGSVTGAVGSVTGAVGSVTGNIGGDVQGNVDGSVASIGTGGVIDGAIAAAELANIADACLDRRLDLGVDNGGNTTTTRTWRQALRAMRNRVVIAGGTMTVYEEDDVTSDFTAAVTTAAGDPISEINPS